jgi:hypothetical protein
MFRALTSSAQEYSGIRASLIDLLEAYDNF